MLTANWVRIDTIDEVFWLVTL